MPGHKKPIKHDTLTFVNEEMTFDEVIDIFKIFGVIKYVNKYLNRFFIQFETPEQARKAQSQLGRIYRVTFAHAKAYPRPRKNFRAQGELIRFSNPADLPKCGYTTSKNNSNGMAMIQNYVNNSTRRHMSSASTRNEVARSNENPRENARGSENRRETYKGSENRREMAKSSKNQSQRSRKQNQRGKPANPKPNSSQVRDPEHDGFDDSDEDTEELEAQKPKAQKRPCDEGEDEEDEYEEEEEEEEEDEDEDEDEDEEEDEDEDEDEDEEEEEGDDDDDDQNQNEEEDQQAEARALGAGTRRRVRIEGLDEIMQELGSDMAYSVIVANIPERYTLDEVYDLVEEVKPIAFSEMDYSIKMRVKFCEVFLNDAADVDYLKQKLNDFVICGKQLTVMEPAEILDETRWNA